MNQLLVASARGADLLLNARVSLRIANQLLREFPLAGFTLAVQHRHFLSENGTFFLTTNVYGFQVVNE